MTREEKINQAATHYEQVDATNLELDYGWGECAIQQQYFKAGVAWADQNPREGLVDINKVEQWIISCFEFLNEAGNHNFKIDKFIDNFHMAMGE